MPKDAHLKVLNSGPRLGCRLCGDRPGRRWSGRRRWSGSAVSSLVGRRGLGDGDVSCGRASTRVTKAMGWRSAGRVRCRGPRRRRRRRRLRRGLLSVGSTAVAGRHRPTRGGRCRANAARRLASVQARVRHRADGEDDGLSRPGGRPSVLYNMPVDRPPRRRTRPRERPGAVSGPTRPGTCLGRSPLGAGPGRWT